MPEDIYKQDRFYVDLQNDEIIWLYHNPDAFSGDQFVRNRFGIDLLKEAIEKCPIGPDSGYEAYPVYDYIESNCRQYLSDVGSAEYGDDIILFQTEPFAIALTQTTLDKLQLLFKAKELINDYSIREFGDPADFSDPAKVGIAYTTTEDDKHEIQVYANLVDFRTEVWLDGENVANLRAESLRDYTENVLPYLDFDEMVAIPDWVIDQFQQTGPYRPDLEYMQFEAWGDVHELCIEAGHYSRGNGLFLQLYEKCGDGELEPYATLTVNLPDHSCGKNRAYVDTNNFPAAMSLISEYRLGRLTGNIEASGYCNYPEYEFNLAEIEKHCLNPEELFDRTPKNKERNDAR